MTRLVSNSEDDRPGLPALSETLHPQCANAQHRFGPGQVKIELKFREIWYFIRILAIFLPKPNITIRPPFPSNRHPD
jgi:hypothetical protein